MIKALYERSKQIPSLVPYGTNYHRGDLTPDIIEVLNELQAMNNSSQYPWKSNSCYLDIYDNVKQHKE